MAIKTHVLKTENGATERAVQVRANDPGSPIDGQIWYNSVEKKLVIFKSGTQVVLNTRTVSVDPVVPQEAESWINSTENTLKYHFGGSTYTIQLAPASGASIQPIGDYYAVLSEEELGSISDSGILYPNYLIDDYNTSKSNATFTNASAQGSALRLNLGQNTGKVEYEMETSTVADMMDGILVVSPRGVKPISVVDNGDGTSTLVIYGDQTGLFANTKKVLVFKEITVDSQVRSIYLTDANGPAVLSVTTPAPSYNVGLNQTTVKITNLGIDILTQLACTADAIRMFPHDVKVEVGANGIAGTLDEVPANDAHGLDSLRTLGGNAFTKISQDLKETVTKVAAKKSPNGQYGFIACAHILPGDVTEIVCYYTNDGFNTLNRIPGGLETGYASGMDLHDNNNGGTYVWLPDHIMQVGDNGKVVFGHYWGNPSGYYHTRMQRVDLTDPSPTCVPFQGFGAGPGIPHDSEVNNHWNVHCVAADAAFDWVYVGYVRSDHIRRDVWYRDGGATFIGTSDQWTYGYVGGAEYARWYENLQGVKQLVIMYTQGASGQALRLRKKKESDLLAAGPWNPSNYVPFRMEDALDGVTRSDIFNGTETAHVYLMSCSMQDDKIRFTCVTSSNGVNHIYSEIDMASPAPGTNEIQHIAFTAVPASGVYQLTFNAQTTANINWNDNASVVQTKLRALTSINSPNVNVTGNTTAGFDVEFVGTLAEANQSLITVFANTLLDGGAAPVTINITTPQPGVAPTPITNSVAVYRHVGASDKVLLTTASFGGDLSDLNPNYQEGGPLGAGDMRVYGIDHILKMDPANANRAFYAWCRQNTAGSFAEPEAMLAQIDDCSTFEGQFQRDDSGTNNNNLGLRADTAGTQTGDKVAQLITFNRTTTVRSIEVLATSTYSNYASMPTGARAANHHIRAKLVGVSGGLPDETNTIEISPTKFSPYEHFTSHNASLFFRFNTAVTNGQQLFLVLYTENFLPSTDWPFAGAGGGGLEYQFLGSTSAPNGAAYYRAGVWNTTGTAFGIYKALYDYFMEPAKTPDLMQYPRYFDIKQPGANYYSRMSELQMELKDSTKLLLSYVVGGDYRNDSNAVAVGKRIIARELNIQALNTFVSGSTSQFLGYENTIDPNLIFQVRHGDPSLQSYDRFGNAVYASASDPLFPKRNIELATGTNMPSYSGVNEFQLNNTQSGQQPDSRFKSGYCMRFNAAGHLYYWMGEYGCLKADNFIIEMEYEPSATDFTNSSVLMTYGSGFWYIQTVAPGVIQMNVGSVTGPALTNATSTSANNTLVAGTYYRLRFTREDDQLIHIYKWTHANPVWTEVSYSLQANCNNQFLTPTADYLHIGAYYNNTDLVYGAIGEVKIAVGTNTFLNGDNVIDQRPIYGHFNLGDRVIARKFISNGTLTGVGDTPAYTLTEAISTTPVNQTGLVAIRDQVLKYTETTLTATGKKLAARVSLDRVSSSDAPAVQGMLLNYSKKPV